MALLIKPDGSVETVLPSNKREGFTLTELYRYCECEIVEMVPLHGVKVPGVPVQWTGKCTMWLDEEGKLKENPAPINLRATQLYHEAGGMRNDVVIGPVLICGPKEVK